MTQTHTVRAEEPFRAARSSLSLRQPKHVIICSLFVQMREVEFAMYFNRLSAVLSVKLCWPIRGLWAWFFDISCSVAWTRGLPSWRGVCFSEPSLAGLHFTPPGGPARDGGEKSPPWGACFLVNPEAGFAWQVAKGAVFGPAHCAPGDRHPAGRRPAPPAGSGRPPSGRLGPDPAALAGGAITQSWKV